jgi:hypothetical protein
MTLVRHQQRVVDVLAITRLPPAQQAVICIIIANGYIAAKHSLYTILIHYLLQVHSSRAFTIHYTHYTPCSIYRYIAVVTLLTILSILTILSTGT